VIFTRENRLVLSTMVLGALSATVYLLHSQFDRLPRILFSRAMEVTAIHLFLLKFFTLYGLYLVAVWTVLKEPKRSSTGMGAVLAIFLFAVLFRVCLLGSAPSLSSDIYRYVWDGRVQTQGVNPYRYPPSADSLASLRDEVIYPNINRQDAPTIYPAGAQIFFLLSHRMAGDSLMGLKGFLVGFDVLSMIVLIGLLRAHGLSETRLVVYAWNPLVVTEIAESGHLEGLVVFLVLSAIYLYTIDKKIFGLLSLAFASATKIYPALLLPALINKGERIRHVLWFFLAILILYVPYGSAGGKLLGFLPIYVTNPYESFNLGLKDVVMEVIRGLDYVLVTKIFLGILFAASFIIFWLPKNREAVIKYSMVLIGLQLILMPTALHPWYVVWLIPLLAFYPSPAWLIFSGTVTLSYLKYVSPTGSMPTWVTFVEYIPLFGLLIAEYVFKGRLLHWMRWRSASEALP
jgi:alpha-1,6-mannosyltransferase